MKESYEEGVANHSAPSFAYCTVRCTAKRKQGIGGLGIELRKDAIRTPTQSRCAEGYMRWGDIASPSSVLRSQRPQTRLETSCSAAKLAANPAGGLPASRTCPVATVVIPDGRESDFF